MLFFFLSDDMRIRSTIHLKIAHFSFPCVADSKQLAVKDSKEDLMLRGKTKPPFSSNREDLTQAVNRGEKYLANHRTFVMLGKQAKVSNFNFTDLN